MSKIANELIKKLSRLRTNWREQQGTAKDLEETFKNQGNYHMALVTSTRSSQLSDCIENISELIIELKTFTP